MCISDIEKESTVLLVLVILQRSAVFFHRILNKQIVNTITLDIIFRQAQILAPAVIIESQSCESIVTGIQNRGNALRAKSVPIVLIFPCQSNCCIIILSCGLRVRRLIHNVTGYRSNRRSPTGKCIYPVIVRILERIVRLFNIRCCRTIRIILSIFYRTTVIIDELHRVFVNRGSEDCLIGHISANRRKNFILTVLFSVLIFPSEEGEGVLRGRALRRSLTLIFRVQTVSHPISRQLRIVGINKLDGILARPLGVRCPINNIPRNLLKGRSPTVELIRVCLVISLRRIRRLIDILDFRSVRVRLLCKKHSIVVINELNRVIILGFGICCGIRHRLRSCRKLRSLRIRMTVIVLPTGKCKRKFLGRISLRLCTIVCRSDSGRNLGRSLKSFTVIIYELDGVRQALDKFLAVNRTEIRYPACVELLIRIARNVCYRRNKGHRTAIRGRGNTVPILRDVDGNFTTGSINSIADAYTGTSTSRTLSINHTAGDLNVRVPLRIYRSDTGNISRAFARKMGSNITATDSNLITRAESASDCSRINVCISAPIKTSGSSINGSAGNCDFTAGYLRHSTADTGCAVSSYYSNRSSGDCNVLSPRGVRPITATDSGSILSTGSLDCSTGYGNITAITIFTATDSGSILSTLCGDCSASDDNITTLAGITITDTRREISAGSAYSTTVNLNCSTGD